MDISYNELKSKEIVNLCDGTKMGRVIDIVFSGESGKVLGFIVPGEKRIFKKNEDVFIPLEKVRRIGDDVILVRFELADSYHGGYAKSNEKKKDVNNKSISLNNADFGKSYIRFRKLDNKKYK